MIKKIIEIIKHPIYIIFYLDRYGIARCEDKKFIEISYYKSLKQKLNLNNPVTFNEKIQWLKLYDRKKEYTEMVDKYEVKKYVANIIGEEYIIPTLGIYEKFEDIDFDNLPNKFVIKCTHDSGSTIVCKNKDTFNINECRKKINKALKKNFFYYAREWPYKNVKPRIIIEKYMVDESGKELKDYKFFNFNGKCKMIQVDFDRFINHKRNLYDTNWELLDLQLQFKNDPQFTIKKPDNLELMIELAEKLSKNIPHLRTDFYYINGKIYFGELTFYHGAGYEKFEPEEWNYKLGKWISLPKMKEENYEK